MFCTMLSFKWIQKLLIVITLIGMLHFSSSEEPRVRKCWKKKYIVEVAMPGTFSIRCRKNVTLHKCEGYCRSEAGPVVYGTEVRWEYRCKCCQPVKYKEVTVIFDKCGSKTVQDIANCHCQPC